MIEYFCKKLYPEIFDNQGFIGVEDKPVWVEDLTLEEALKEFGNVNISEIRYKFPHKSTKTLQQPKSKFSIYGIHNEAHYEIYLSTSSGTLYVPFKAITEKDFGLVEKRHTSYHQDYYKSKPDSIKQALTALQTPEAALLRTLLSN